MRSIRRSARKLSLLTVILTMLIGSASAFAQVSPTPKFTATPLSPSDQYSVTSAKDGVSQPQGGLSLASANTSKMVSVIVKLNSASLASYKGDVPGLAATSPQVTGAEKIDLQSSASKQYLSYVDAQQDTFVANAKQAIPNATVTQRLDIVVGGVAMVVPEDQVSVLAKLPGVTAVYPDQLLKLDTERSPQFIGAPTIWNQLGGQGSAGEGVVVGVLDTGVWPEHPSFSDPDPSGKPYAAPPPPISGTRQCEFSGGANPGQAFSCNNKLIGADRFMATYDALVGLIPGEFTTARDDNGHGTHTSSTSAGNSGVAASIFGVSRGTISGIAPRAHVIMYKVCGDQGCFSSDSAAAIQKAITDGVKVINFSISGGNDPYGDPVELAFLDAYSAGVFVAASAGNSGPTAETVAHRGPWVTTVAASTADRAFKNTVSINGGVLTLSGTSLTSGVGPAPVVSAADAPYSNNFCNNPAPAGTFAGKIVVCQRGDVSGRVQKGFNVLQGGAVGMILYNTNPATTDQETDNHFLPTSHIQFADGTTLLAFLTAHPGATATMTAGVAGAQPGDVMASFSSRGGPLQTLGVSKPDITAPGVQILAGHTPQSVDLATGPTGELFQAIAGTSMSSPHIAGSGALIKALHPTWTPGQIKSALMTTALTKVLKEDGSTPANAFDDGSGRVNLNVAGDPGLTFDVTGAQYVAHENDLWATNYPSAYVPVFGGAATLERIAHSVLPSSSKWKLKATTPSDVKIKLEPDKLTVAANGNATFKINIDARDVPLGEVRFATLTISQDGGGKRELHIPVTIVRNEPNVKVNKECAPDVFPKNAGTDCTITITNTSLSAANVSLFDKLPDNLNLINNSVLGGTQDHNRVLFSGSLAGVQPPNVTIASVPNSSPAGYLPLSAFGIAPVGGVGDDTLTNFNNVPAFTYAGQTYTRIGFASNGYAVIGGGTGADVSINNQNFPNPSPPNNTLAAFWTDLNPAAAGALRIGILTDGSDTWIVLDWEGVREFSLNKKASFQIWIGVAGDANPGEDITFTYGTIEGNGDGGFLSVGAENFQGNRGQNTYFNGAGTLPSNGTELLVTGTPGVGGGEHKVTFHAIGEKTGKWVNYAELTSDTFFGTNIARFAGEVTKK